MAYIFANPNPAKKLVGDCVIRAIAILTDRSWDSVYLDLIVYTYKLKDMPSSNNAWISYLKSLGFSQFLLPDTCPDCYTVSDFAKDNPKGSFLLGTGSHVVAIVDGDYYDTWDSGEEIPIYFFSKGN